MNNTTSLLLQENITQEFIDIYDSVGAIIFIIVILLWYSFGIIFLLGMQMIVPTEVFIDSSKYSKQLFTSNFREKTNNKTILEELINKENRDKLWNIYLGTSTDINDKINREDLIRIHNIQRQLTSIDENYQDTYERTRFVDDNHTFLPSSNRSSFSSRLHIRRHISLDQGILNKWKTNVDDLKTDENESKINQKSLIRRHIRRHRHSKDHQFLRKLSIP